MITAGDYSQAVPAVFTTIFWVGFAATAAQVLASRSFEIFTGAAAFAFGISVCNLAECEDIKPREVLDNARLHRRKTKRWTVAPTAAAAGICLSTVSLVLHTGGRDKQQPGQESLSRSVDRWLSARSDGGLVVTVQEFSSEAFE
ncbi:hypothetical protein [Streptomyces sp. NPDC006368]|uniref:hypothetical protein n=1 Tax=Streptomyces sp. NPDC006368 TaxID=3156760 RepID=UPI0033AEB39F